MMIMADILVSGSEGVEIILPDLYFSNFHYCISLLTPRLV